MSYEIAGEDGVALGQFASGGGYADFIATIKPANHPALASFIHHGASEDIPAVVKDLDALIGQDKDADVVSTAQAMRDLLEGLDLALIVDGTFDDTAQHKRAFGRAYEDQAARRSTRRVK